jgi:hypothetical protein
MPIAKATLATRLWGKYRFGRMATAVLPVEGWVSENEWQGYIPFEELPYAYNPEQGFLVSANNRIEPEGYPYYISDGYTPGYRAQQIEDLLQEYAPLTVEDMDLIQEDTYSPQAELLMPFLDVIEAQKPRCKKQPWKRCSIGTCIPTLKVPAHPFTKPGTCASWQRHLRRAGRVGSRPGCPGTSADTTCAMPPSMARCWWSMMEDPNHPWFDNINTPEVETRDDIIPAKFRGGCRLDTTPARR